jgi:2'-5' RNA ligase
MPALIDVNTLPNDKFGYRIYGVMAHLPERQAEQVRKFHRIVGAHDLATKPHCSIDNFWGPPDLDAVKGALARVASSHAPFETEADPDDVRAGDWGCAFSLKPVSGLQRLHEAVKTALIPLTQRIYPSDGAYWPHTTVLLDAKPEERPKIKPSLPKINMSGTMRFGSIELIGRVGPSRGGEYHILGSWPLTGKGTERGR